MMSEEIRSALDDQLFQFVEQAEKRPGLATLARLVTLFEENVPHLTARIIESRPGYPFTRTIDKALQRLRKAGKIFYFSPVIGWRPVKEKPAPPDPPDQMRVAFREAFDALEDMVGQHGGEETCLSANERAVGVLEQYRELRGKVST